MISVIQVTNRFGGFDILWSSLRRQTFKDWELIYCDTLHDIRALAVKEYTKDDPRVVHFKQTPKDPEAKTWLAHAENQAIKQVKGELIVFLQDFIFIKPDALEKFWLQYNNDKNCFVSGVGHQYQSEPVTNPNGLITVFSKPQTQLPQQIVWQDPRLRKDLGSFYECKPEDWEINFAMCPRKMLFDIGGMDESYDYVGFAFDNVSAAFRGYALGYKPYLDQSNESFSINSDAWAKSPAKTQQNFIDIATYHQRKMKQIVDGEIDINLGYL